MQEYSFQYLEVRGSFVNEKQTDPNHSISLGFLGIETELYKYEINSASIHDKAGNYITFVFIRSLIFKDILVFFLVFYSFLSFFPFKIII